jgi:antitoxin PrlF
MRTAAAFSKVSVKNQTVIPREVRERLAVKLGDTLRYRVTDAGVLLDKVPASKADGPFAAFSEWSSGADEKAYGSLKVTARKVAQKLRGFPG